MKKLKFKQIWGYISKFLKDNWEWVAGIAVLVVFGLYFVSRANSLEDLAKQFSVLNQKRRNDFKKSVKKREEILENRSKVIEELSTALDKIDQKFDEKEEELKKQNKKEIQEVANEMENKPEKFTKDLSEKYDLNYVEEK